jgi:hypothetical protein
MTVANLLSEDWFDVFLLSLLVILGVCFIAISLRLTQLLVIVIEELRRRHPPGTLDRDE